MTWIIETKAYGARTWRQDGATHATEGDARASLCGKPRAHRTRLRNTTTSETLALPCGPRCKQCWPGDWVITARPGCSHHRTAAPPRRAAPRRASERF